MIITLQDDVDVQFRILHIFLVLAPKLFVETMFMMKDFNELWAKITFVVRVITIALGIILILTEVILIAVIEDDDLAQEISLPIVIIIGALLIGIDIYFTLMYYQYLKYPELRQVRSSKGLENEIGEETGQNVQDTGNVAITSNALVSSRGHAVRQNLSSRPIRTADNEAPSKTLPKVLSHNDEVELKIQEDDVRM